MALIEILSIILMAFILPILGLMIYMLWILKQVLQSYIEFETKFLILIIWSIINFSYCYIFYKLIKLCI